MPFADSFWVFLPVDISPQTVDELSNFKRCLEAEKILQILHRIEYQILSQ